MSAPYGLGAIESPADPRRWTLASVGAPTAYPDSAFVPLFDKLGVRNQAKIGSCVGNTFEEIVRKICWQIALAGDPNAKEEELSWRFVYAVCKCLDGYADEGTYPYLAAKVVRTYGVPLAKYCPNDVSLEHEAFVYGRNFSKIPQAAFADAVKRKVGADLTTELNADGVKRAIAYAAANNGGVAICRRIGDTYWRDAQGSTYDKARLLPMRAPATIVSGHAESLYGYDKDPKNGRTRIYWLNHWSDGWCSTGGFGHDGGRAWEYLDTWLPFFTEIRVSVAAIPEPTGSFKYRFSKTMQRGAEGPDVVALQHVLNLEGVFDWSALTGYYGDITVAGVVRLQQKHADEILAPLGLVHGTGTVGASTLAWLNRHYGA